jgi:hypothetical protein
MTPSKNTFVERRAGMKEFREDLKKVTVAVDKNTVALLAVEKRMIAYEVNQTGLQKQANRSTDFIDGTEGHEGARSIIHSQGSRITMLFIIGGALASAFLALLGSIVAGVVVAWVIYQTNLAGALVHMVMH